MKKATYVVYMGFLALVLLAGCFDVEELAPAFDAESVKTAVQGRWAVEKVNNKLCRDNTCSENTVTGHPQEYFEFRADSAFLLRSGPSVENAIHDAYKASYEANGVILLSNTSRTERFEVLELKARRIVVQSVFTGRDPAAVFTDTYYLFK
ncbi:hypothetical protein ABID22_001827 [Pontibacter aydingkolensis]|uniref:Lipocalin-like domain-containing protein n=1 Tax=Pontibacter aydingkolensis TaxID=1911536 RepID=A0ABS7CPL4_9BACT|nr:hypothetical protein [Pontibacter aydingkolensis]MBW7465787.1 hypothetical protein [Pontibacter aydingkolensis]